jgi:hypothetical protein
MCARCGRCTDPPDLEPAQRRRSRSSRSRNTRPRGAHAADQRRSAAFRFVAEAFQE